MAIENGWYRIMTEVDEDYLFPPELFIQPTGKQAEQKVTIMSDPKNSKKEEQWADEIPDPENEPAETE